MKPSRGALAIFLLLAGCSQAPPYPVARPDGRNVIVFVHGYYGSSLAEKSGGPRRFLQLSKMIWGHFRIGLAQQELGFAPAPELEAEGLLGTFRILPLFYSLDIYEGFLKNLEKSTGRQVIPYVYDWRMDLPTAAQGLADLIGQLKADGKTKVSLAAHSMGGLVATHFLRANPGAVQTVAFLATPFGGSTSVLRNMQHGTGYAWNPALLEPNTVASFPASYQLIPYHRPILLEANGALRPELLSDETLWPRQRLGLWHHESPEAFRLPREQYALGELRRAVTAHKNLFLQARAPARVLNVIGEGTPTLDRAYWQEGRLVLLANEARSLGLDPARLEADGDGTVSVEAAGLPDWLSRASRTLRTKHGHGEVFLDPQIQAHLFPFLQET